MKTYLVAVTVRVTAEDREGARYLVQERARRAFAESLIDVSEPTTTTVDEYYQGAADREPRATGG